MTRIELENRVWLSAARYVKRVLELGKVYAHV